MGGTFDILIRCLILVGVSVLCVVGWVFFVCVGWRWRFFEVFVQFGGFLAFFFWAMVESVQK